MTYYQFAKVFIALKLSHPLLVIPTEKPGTEQTWRLLPPVIFFPDANPYWLSRHRVKKSCVPIAWDCFGFCTQLKKKKKEKKGAGEEASTNGSFPLVIWKRQLIPVFIAQVENSAVFTGLSWSSLKRRAGTEQKLGISERFHDIWLLSSP